MPSLITFFPSCKPQHPASIADQLDHSLRNHHGMKVKYTTLGNNNLYRLGERLQTTLQEKKLCKDRSKAYHGIEPLAQVGLP